MTSSHSQADMDGLKAFVDIATNNVTKLQEDLKAETGIRKESVDRFVSRHWMYIASAIALSTRVRDT